MSPDKRVRYWRWCLWAAFACLGWHWLAAALFLATSGSWSDRLVVTKLEFVTAAGCVALALAGIFGPGLRRRLIATMIMLIMLASALLSSLLPEELDRVRLRDGRTIVLADEFTLTAAIWGLWRPVEIFPMLLRPVGASISYSEDLSWTENPGLALSPDGRHLLVRRGGIWTDCLLTEDKLTPCPGTSSSLDPQKPEDWIRQSEQIEAMTGMSAGPPAKRQRVKRP